MDIGAADLESAYGRVKSEFWSRKENNYLKRQELSFFGSGHDTDLTI